MKGVTALSSLSEKILKKLGLYIAVVSSRFQDNLQMVLSENTPIDYALFNGRHDEKATFSYFGSFIPYLSNKRIMVFDDISWSDGMRRAWSKNVEIDNQDRIGFRKDWTCVVNDGIHGKSIVEFPPV